MTTNALESRYVIDSNQFILVPWIAQTQTYKIPLRQMPSHMDCSVNDVGQMK